MLTSNTAYISGRGHGSATSSAEVFRDTLVEAATVTQGAGYRYFVIVSQQDESRRGAIVDGVGNSLFVTPVRNAGTGIQIQMFNPGQIDPSQPGVWDAADVLATHAANQPR